MSMAGEHISESSGTDDTDSEGEDVPFVPGDGPELHQLHREDVPVAEPLPLPVAEQPAAAVPAAEPAAEPAVEPIRAPPGSRSFYWGPFSIAEVWLHGLQIGWLHKHDRNLQCISVAGLVAISGWIMLFRGWIGGGISGYYYN